MLVWLVIWLLFNQFPEGKLPKEAQEVERLVTPQFAQLFFEEEVFGALKYAHQNDSIKFIRDSIEAMRHKVSIVPVKSFYRDKKGIAWPLVGATPAKMRMKDGVEKAVIMLYVPAFYEVSISNLPEEKKREFILSVILHEYLHIKYDQNHPGDAINESKEAVVREEAAVWAEQIEKMLQPMQRAKRYLHPTTLEVMRAYTKYKKNQKRWQAWISDNRTPYAKPSSQRR